LLQLKMCQCPYIIKAFELVRCAHIHMMYDAFLFYAHKFSVAITGICLKNIRKAKYIHVAVSSPECKEIS
jgi:hypothetical protein